MIAVDRSKLKAEWRHTAEYMPNLEEFLQKVAMAKPLCSFAVTDKCVMTNHYRDKETDTVLQRSQIYAIKVYENGEKLGEIGVTDRYRNGSNEKVYFVNSFRIIKFRGGRHTTTSADIKVALRVVKQSFVARS